MGRYFVRSDSGGPKRWTGGDEARMREGVCLNVDQAVSFNHIACIASVCVRASGVGGSKVR